MTTTALRSASAPERRGVWTAVLHSQVCGELGGNRAAPERGPFERRELASHGRASRAVMTGSPCIARARRGARGWCEDQVVPAKRKRQLLVIAGDHAPLHCGLRAEDSDDYLSGSRKIESPSSDAICGFVVTRVLEGHAFEESGLTTSLDWVRGSASAITVPSPAAPASTSRVVPSGSMKNAEFPRPVLI